MNKPTLSVCISNYNHACYIGQALGAILAQKFKPMEVIAIDDASSDNSAEIINKLSRNYPIIRFLQNDRNRGCVYSNRRALNLTSGNYVYGASADDKVLPGFFEKSMDMLMRYPEAGLCCSDYSIFNTSTGKTTEIKLHWSNRPCYLSPRKLTAAIRKGYIPGITTIAKRAAIMEAGGMIPDLKWRYDWFEWLVIGFRHGICYIPEIMATMRSSPDSFSASEKTEKEQKIELLRNLIRLLKSQPYCDVLPYFIRSNSMRPFGIDTVRALVNSPEQWDIQSLMLIRELPLNEIKRILSPATPSWLKHAYYCICNG